MLGLNVTFEIERLNDDPDDAIGGAVTTGTVILTGLSGRIEANLLSDDLTVMNQGLETLDYFRVTMQPGNQDIRPRDLFRITSPADHPYYNENMRIVKRSYSNFVPSDPRDYMILELTRSHESHTIQ